MAHKKLNKEEKMRRSQERRIEKYNKTHKEIDGITYKYCKKCDKWLEATIDNFYKSNTGFLKLQPDCKECVKENSINWKFDNPEKYRESFALKDKKYERQFYLDYKREWRKKNEQHVKDYQKEYYDNNRDKLKMYGEKRSMHKKHKISKVEWEACKKYFNDSCAYCGLNVIDHKRIWYGELKQFDLHKEHVNHEGANDLSNCVPACQSCNSKKHDKEFYDWYNEKNIIFSNERLSKIHMWLNDEYKKIQI